MPQVFLKRGKSKPFFSREPLVFSGAIQQVVGKPLVAEMVDVYSADKKLIGMGLFNPNSNYRVRLLSFASENLPNSLPEIIAYRLEQAIAKRKTLNLPNEQTNAYRLLNSEADGISGLTIDVFADYTVASVTAYWLMLYQQVVVECLATCGFTQVIWRPQAKALAQDGWTVEEADVAQLLTTIKENGISYQVDVGQGQKTGFYCDQRDNRLIVQEHAKQRTLLDAFCYSGGFALNAIKGGASKVVGIDSSAPAIELAKSNAELNHFSNIQFEQAKAEDYLASIDAGSVDFIVLDPPKLAPSKQSLPRAKQRYIKLNQLAIALLPKGGLLLTCSCSNALNKKDFIELLQTAAKKAGRHIDILQTTSAAEDHPYLKQSNYGNYLKAVFIKVR